MTRAATYRIVALAALLGIGAYRYQTTKTPADVGTYHAAIRESVKRVPAQIDGWVGEDIPVPVQATILLQPNLMISRRYVNVETGLGTTFLLVHCADAHDMAGHFPLRCYPAQGWEVAGREARDWQAGDLKVTGTEYHFTRPAELKSGRVAGDIVVANFLLRPGGHVLRDMDEMTALIHGARGQALGAAQVQVCFDGTVPAEARERAVSALVRGYRPVIDAILADPGTVGDGGEGGGGGGGSGAVAAAGARP